MRPERISLESVRDNDSLVKLAARIRDGAVFVYPTETIYGIGGVIEDEVEGRILAAKKRGPDKHMILVAGSRDSFASLGLEFDKHLQALADAFWPGNLTIVVPSKVLGRDVGVRVSAHPFLTALAEHLHQPVYSTSANLSGQPYVNDTDTIFARFAESIDFMIDAGPLPPSQPSTVVGPSPESGVALLREGAIPASEIYQVAGKATLSE
ncbi:MAG: threonylcarbamoyl-AMP synthase [Chitinivibrionales bacterium]|nr:threonylcarbamoyl-AMP synthase [Chitinivibrionales bacterium]MBD3396414.1 threonylcarbamoyl-AMP synthase [Chitinivibrionales bacterium]